MINNANAKVHTTQQIAPTTLGFASSESVGGLCFFGAVVCIQLI